MIRRNYYLSFLVSAIGSLPNATSNTYNASGHRIKREYVGCDCNTEPFINLPHMQ